MIKEEHRIDTVAFLYIAVVCTIVMAAMIVNENTNLRNKADVYQTKEKEYKHTIDSLKSINDSLRLENLTIIDYCEESMRLYENKISYLKTK